MHGDPGKVRQDPGGVHRGDTALVGHGEKHVLHDRGRGHPPEPAGDPHAGLIEVCHRRGDEPGVDLLD